jgi:hypothetical protein
MDIKHKTHEHKDRAILMQRLYKREGNKFIPCGWLCPDCKMMLPD